MPRERKIHLPCSDPWVRPNGWDTTECGLPLGRVAITEDGVEHATCYRCIRIRDGI